MLKQLFIPALVAIMGLSLAACQTAPSNESTGQVVGGVVGGILGSQIGGGRGKTAATIAGVLVGGYLGGKIGRSMDANDQRRAYESLEHNRTNEPSSWHNPDSNRDYTVTPTNTYKTAEGYCRDYTTEVMIEGRREVAKGTACRQPDGSWRVIN
ncbi:MAG: RT0821/Lpp0805 family surface protein [Granulosicoccaceae bacterium]|jgi:surface antigen